MNHPILSDDILITDIDTAIIMPPNFNPQLRHSDRPGHGFAYSVSAVIEYRFDTGITLLCTPGTLIYLPRGSSYTVNPQNPGYVACINFRILDDSQMNDPFCVPIDDTASVERAYHTACQCLSSHQPGYLNRIRACTYEIMSILQAGVSATYQPTARMRQVDETVRYIHEHYTEEDISLSQLVAMTDIGEVYYRRLFRAKYGTTPVKYILNLRIDYAKHLIRDSACTVEFAAQMVGFSSAAYFCRQFRALTGMTPKEYRNMMRSE
ncbi:MAG: AraC family transcriptional regulator [Clostridia bacterium]|nr:AraC family transcriptional regulator [Clostridia bacterium]